LVGREFKAFGKLGNSWINSIINARKVLRTLFLRYPSLRAKAQDRENLQTAWKVAVYNLIDWFEKPKNHDLVKKYFGRIPTEKDFPKDCPFTFEQNIRIQTLAKG
jgi:hypothetical protein